MGYGQILAASFCLQTIAHGTISVISKNPGTLCAL